MARTFRRNKKYLILKVVGTIEHTYDDRAWFQWRYPDLAPELAYSRCKARYTRDHHPGRHGVPRWFRRMHGSKALRLDEQCKLHRSLRRDEWDDHLPENRTRNASWDWW